MKRLRYECKHCQKTVEVKYRPEKTFVDCPECEGMEIPSQFPILVEYKLVREHLCDGPVCKKCKEFRTDERRRVIYSDCCGGKTWQVISWCPKCGEDHWMYDT